MRILILPLFFVVSSLIAKEMIRTPPDFPVLGELEPILETVMLKEGGKDESLGTVVEDPRIAGQIEKHGMKLFGGPMLGCITTNSAKVWLRTAGPAKVTVGVGAHGDEILPANPVAPIQTTAASDFTAVFDLMGLVPGGYRYSVEVNGEHVFSGLFRIPRARGNVLSFAMGGGARYNPPKERIWDTIAKDGPDGFLWLGDNLYQDKPENRSLQRLYYYRRQLRPEFQRLTGSCASYAIWDDHDFGDNDVSGGPEVDKPAWKIPVWKVFQENWVNPAYGNGPERPGCWFRHRIGDVELFMTDGRYYRDFKNGNTMLGPHQLAWLKAALADSTATFKVLASGTLWTEHADKGGKDSWWGVKGEREEIFSWIEEKRIPGVVLVSADRHRTDIYKIERPNGYDFYEFETSKLTNNHTHGTRKEAIFSYNKGNFYGLLTFDTTLADPTVTFACKSIDGELIHEFPVKLSQLRGKDW